jgi:ubiquinone/menaquinone biosynthesis C-methylase UbiE
MLPNLLRLVDPRRGETIVDLACGNGYFAKAFSGEGAVVTGIDISEELIAIARKNTPAVSYHVGKAEDCPIISSGAKDKVVIVLAIQNMEHVQKVFAEAARMLKLGGTIHVVMNHPAFRIPKASSWEYDDKKRVQYRRIDQYMSESTSAIDMHPGMTNSPQTISFHRPLQYYMKALAKSGFAIDRFEEWISHKDSDSGPRAKAENDARKEIPLFLYLRAQKLAD